MVTEISGMTESAQGGIGPKSRAVDDAKYGGFESGEFTMQERKI